MICLLEPYFQRCRRLIPRIKLKHVCVIFGVLMLLDLFGAFTHMFEVSYEDYFTYPYEGDVSALVEDLKHHKKPKVDPINQYNFSYIHDIKEHCVDEDYHTLRIIFLIKSAVENFDRRTVIRKTWGFKKRFFDVPTRTVFLLGKHNDDKLQIRVDKEAKTYKDIMQGDFIDSYYNNTIKTMVGFRWAVNHCLNSKFYMFVDDDMYVSVKNVLRFIRNPTSYPDYLKEPSRIGSRKREIRLSDMPNFTKLPNGSTIINYQSSRSSLESHRVTRATAREKIMLKRKSGWTSHNKTRIPMEMSTVEDINITSHVEESSNLKRAKNATKPKSILSRGRRQVFDFDLPDDVRLFAGYVFISSPHRHKTSKWYISLNEYPFDLWPPYVTAGAYILSKEALVDMYYTSVYTKHFRFDDIFLGLVAKKADIEPFHCDEFHFYKKDYTRFNYKYVITSHGYGNPDELSEVWNEQKSLGNA